MKYVVDTNVLLESPEIIKEQNCIILSHVIRELEKHKQNINQDLSYKARQATRYIDKYYQLVEFDFTDYNTHFDYYDNSYVDNKIIQCCLDNSYGLITNDLLLKHKARGHKVYVLELDQTEIDYYKGYKEVVFDDQQIAEFYEDLRVNHLNIITNEYLIIKNKQNEVIESVRWDGGQFQYAHQKGFSTNLFGKFKTFDTYQSCALDSLVNNQMTMIKGKAGSGKSMIAINYAWSQIEKGKYEKLIIFTNPVASKNSARLGFYPGTRNEKLLESQTGTMLASKFGDIMEVERQIAQGKIVLLPFADIRGFDSTGMKAIVWFLECQNLDRELMKLGISRCGNDSKIILDGDYSGQVDMDAYAGANNGMRRVSEVFRGKDFYGEVELQNVHRSKMAEIADML